MGDSKNIGEKFDKFAKRDLKLSLTITSFRIVGRNPVQLYK